MKTGASESLLGSKIVPTKSEVEDLFEVVEQIGIDVRKNLDILPNKSLKPTASRVARNSQTRTAITTKQIGSQIPRHATAAFTLAKIFFLGLIVLS